MSARRMERAGRIVALISGLIDQARGEIIEPSFEAGYFPMVASLDRDDREPWRDVGVGIDDGLVQVFGVTAPAAASQIRATPLASGSNLVTGAALAFSPEQGLTGGGIAYEHGRDGGQAADKSHQPPNLFAAERSEGRHLGSFDALGDYAEKI